MRNGPKSPPIASQYPGPHSIAPFDRFAPWELIRDRTTGPRREEMGARRGGTRELRTDLARGLVKRDRDIHRGQLGPGTRNSDTLSRGTDTRYERGPYPV
jgi:hypothetical protein